MLTLYAYADFKIPKQFDCIFQLNDSSNFVIDKFRLNQSIYEGWHPINSIEEGHKHLCVFEFKNRIPEIINGLHIAKEKYSNAHKGALKLRIFQSDDFNQIRKRLENIFRLKEKHGMNWLQYDEN